MPSKVRKVPKEKLSEDLKRIQEDNEKRDTLHRTGQLGEVGYRLKPTFVEKSARTIMSGIDNSAVIIIDNDPIYSAGGGGFASRIQIVAGVSGSFLKGEDHIDELTPIHDAAGIYMSQKGDPQLIFAGPEGDGPVLANPGYAMFGEMEETSAKLYTDTIKSHVTTCADIVQIIGKNGGVNIYAGGVGSKLSTGIPNREYMGVNLIYGNKLDYAYSDSPYSLQPLVKGHNLEKALISIIERIDDLNNTVFGLMLAIGQMEINLAAHTHITAGVGVGVAAPSIELLIGAALRAPQQVKTTLKTITNSINNVIAEINQSSLTTAGINSRFNKTN